ncbi:MAG: undecaprenyldiphospho-muramoylpentapeptide beta-N-acetylglucosaminyltransferase [Thermodesulfobacteriota bacterium]|nr:undecaprenyldiphospho-muramoylpentapeptide beta-N-acetylglucosaminyltransferase [Thermodesulfobacteriota bacterium]
MAYLKPLINDADVEVRVIIAGGGTGGHVFPALAIAEEFVRRNRKTKVLFVGTKRGLEGRVLRDGAFPIRFIDIEGIRGKSFTGILRGALKIPRSLFQSWGIIRAFDPHIMIGVGGYASGPAVFAAYLMGVKTAIAEQNALPGLTNRILGRFTKRIFLAFPDRRGIFPEKKVVVAGNPVRNGFIEEGEREKKKNGKFTLLIFGGSQGASAINMAVMEALEYMEGIRDGLKIIHQTGEKDLGEVANAYSEHRIDAKVVPFITDMAEACKEADLLICRAGATSIAEITALGKAAIFIPYPFATGNHQELNAKMLVDAGAAEMIVKDELSGRLLFEMIEKLYRNPGRIETMEKMSKSLGNIKAASNIVDECLTIIGQ